MEHHVETPQSSTERVEVTSGIVVCMDQFMLSNPDFVNALPKDFNPQSPNFVEEVNNACNKFGGVAVKMNPGVFTVFREPYEGLLSLFSEYSKDDINLDVLDELRDNGESIGDLTIDTRRIGVCDVSLCYKDRLMEECRKLRRDKDSKGSRDLLRESGASIRYSFDKRPGERLVVFFDKKKEILLVSKESAIYNQDSQSEEPLEEEYEEENFNRA